MPNAFIDKGRSWTFHVYGDPYFHILFFRFTVNNWACMHYPCLTPIHFLLFFTHQLLSLLYILPHIVHLNLDNTRFMGRLFQDRTAGDFVNVNAFCNNVTVTYNLNSFLYTRSYTVSCYTQNSGQSHEADKVDDLMTEWMTTVNSATILTE